jgi:hypothetical protein
MEHSRRFGLVFCGRLENGKLEADSTIFLWDDPELMAHSAERNLSQLTLVVQYRIDRIF